MTATPTRWAAKAASLYDPAYARRYRAHDDELRRQRSRTARSSSGCGAIVRCCSPPIDVLDLGCGTGRYFWALRGVRDLVGIDASAAMLEPRRVIRCNADRITAERVTLVEGDLLAHDFGAGALRSRVFDRRPRRARAVRRDRRCRSVARWLKPGGVSRSRPCIPIAIDPADVAGAASAARSRRSLPAPLARAAARAAARRRPVCRRGARQGAARRRRSRSNRWSGSSPRRTSIACASPESERVSAAGSACTRHRRPRLHRRNLTERLRATARAVTVVTPSRARHAATRPTRRGATASASSKAICAMRDAMAAAVPARTWCSTCRAVGRGAQHGRSLDGSRRQLPRQPRAARGAARRERRAPSWCSSARGSQYGAAARAAGRRGAGAPIRCACTRFTSWRSSSTCGSTARCSACATRSRGVTNPYGPGQPPAARRTASSTA